MPSNLLEEFERGNVVIFAGAGISTETSKVLKYTFYDSIASELGKANPTESFPDLMEAYCSQINGRLQLLGKIRQRLQHIRSFQELNNAASMFHQELASMYFLNTIVTTNWDTYFEDDCAAVPFMTDADLAFWDAAERRVLKIHGSANHFGSIIATKKDYDACEVRLQNGLTGSVLKTLLATRTLVFVGYSLRDSDFQNIFKFVHTQMEGLHRQAYVINPFSAECLRFSESGFVAIETDATFFFRRIKDHFVESGQMYSDEIYSEATRQRKALVKEHNRLEKRFPLKAFPQVIYALAYQDGLMHAFDRVVTQRSSGEYSNPSNYRRLLHGYDEIQRKKRSRKAYADVAYIEGYVNALLYLAAFAEKVISLFDEDSEGLPIANPPRYFAFGAPRNSSCRGEIFSYEEFSALAPELPKLHKASFSHAIQLTKSLGHGLTFHHPPWL